MSYGINIHKLWDQLWDQECYIPSLDDEIDEMDDEDYEYCLHLDYSGRGMYGRTCIALEGPTATQAAIHLAAAVSTVTHIALNEIVIDIRTDSMGRDGIAYLPGYEAYIDTRSRGAVE
jgi:hypothetical protein